METDSLTARRYGGTGLA